MEKLIKQFSLSKITLGTMRFLDKNLSVDDVIKLIEQAHSMGINTHHSSLEYNSYDLYTNALYKTSVNKKIKHIVKLSSPHFEENSFSEKKLEEKIDAQLQNLNIDCIDVLQWLIRSKPINDKDRINILKNQKKEIEFTLEKLKKKGKIKSVFSFPYSVPFAKKVLELTQIDGIISYLNKEEIDYSEFANTNPFIAIRPLFAGNLVNNSSNEFIKNNSIKNSMLFSMNHKKVISTVVGINSINQLNTYKSIL